MYLCVSLYLSLFVDFARPFSTCQSVILESLLRHIESISFLLLVLFFVLIRSQFLFCPTFLHLAFLFVVLSVFLFVLPFVRRSVRRSRINRRRAELGCGCPVWWR